MHPPKYVIFHYFMFIVFFYSTFICLCLASLIGHFNFLDDILALIKSASRCSHMADFASTILFGELFSLHKLYRLSVNFKYSKLNTKISLHTHHTPPTQLHKLFEWF